MNHPECDRCALHKSATNIGIGGNGDDQPDILVVLDYITYLEDRDGVACHPEGQATSILRAMCESVAEQTGLKFRFTTAVRCAPAEATENGKTKSRTPTAKEISSCLPWLQKEILATNPKVVVLAGSTSLKAVLGRDCRISDMRGNPVWREDRVYLPTYHPVNMLSTRAGQTRHSLTTPEQFQEMLIQDLCTAANIATGTQTKPEEISWKVIKTKAEALEVLAELQSAQAGIDMLAVDIETNTYDNTEVDNIFKAGLKILCIGLSWENNVSHVIPLEQDDCAWRDDYDFQRTLIHALWALKCKFVLQNGIYDFVALHLRYGVAPFHAYHDTLLMHHLLWSHLPHSLRELAKTYTPFGGYDDEVKTLVAALPVKERGYHKIPFAAVARKNAYDAAITRTLGVKFLAEVSKDEQLLWVYENVTIPVSSPLMKMSLRGVGMSVEDARQAMADNKIRHHKITQILEEVPEWSKAEDLLGEKIEVSKSAHRMLLLFHPDCCGLTPTKFSKKTDLPSTDKAVLDDLADQSVVAYGIRKLRAVETFSDKILKPIPKWIGADGRVHTTYKIHGTRTGRLSSADPNLQNIGRESLHLLKAAPGYQLIVCDISQAEIRMNGIVSDEPRLLEAFKAGIGPDGKPIDIHATVAQEMFGISYDQAKTDEVVRRIVKGLSFGITYGMTRHGLSVRIHKTPDEAQALIDLYFQRFPRIKKNLFEGTKQMLLEHGHVRTLFGRYWHLDDHQKVAMHELKQKGMRGFWDAGVPAQALRQAANCRIQSPTSDMVLRGLIKFEQESQKTYTVNVPGADLYLSNEIHDSVIVEAKEEFSYPIAELLKHCMENPEVPFEVPIPWIADLKIGYDMGNLEKVEM